MTVARVLSNGVDSLYLSVRGELKGGILMWVGHMIEMAGEGTEPIPFSFHDPKEPEFALRRHYGYGYAAWMSSPRYELFFGRDGHFPQAMVQLHSAYIHTVGVEEAVRDVETLLRWIIFERVDSVVVSRIDLYADTQGWAPKHEDFHRFVCRAVTRKLYEVPSVLHGRGRELSGFVFGKDAVVARIYNKSIEMRVRGSTWQELIWEGRDETQPVWRIEFQFRRTGLRSFRLRTIDEVLHVRQALWEYGLAWLSLRTPSPRTRKDRWPVAPAWQDIRSTWMGSARSTLIRERIRGADGLRLMRGLVGYATSLAALEDTGALEGVIVSDVPGVRQYLAHRGMGFGEIVEEKEGRRIEIPAPVPAARPRGDSR